MQTIDRLDALLSRFRVAAELSTSGPLCGRHAFDAAEGVGWLHVLREGELRLQHRRPDGRRESLELREPTLLFYPRPLTHRFDRLPRHGAHFTCARVRFEGGAHNPLALALPECVVLPLARVEGLAATLALLFAETDRARCGQRLLADRLFEVLLIQLLRWMLDHPAEAGVQAGLVAGLSDARLARALVAMHAAPGEPWPLERMAACAGMSRTSFATSFRRIVGHTPAGYLADWRVALAQAGLRAGRPVKQLADELGYANPSALSRAFAARTGRSPRRWREASAADPPAPG